MTNRQKVVVSMMVAFLTGLSCYIGAAVYALNGRLDGCILASVPATVLFIAGILYAMRLTGDAGNRNNGSSQQG